MGPEKRILKVQLFFLTALSFLEYVYRTVHHNFPSKIYVLPCPPPRLRRRWPRVAVEVAERTVLSNNRDDQAGDSFAVRSSSGSTVRLLLAVYEGGEEGPKKADASGVEGEHIHRGHVHMTSALRGSEGVIKF